MSKTLLLGSVLLLAGCDLFTQGTYEPKVEMYLACAGYAKALPIATTFKPRMSPDQVKTIDVVVELVGPICRAAEDGRIDAADVEDVRARVRDLVLLTGAF